jgi:O-antigen/teichoic acid export membrane protein
LSLKANLLANYFGQGWRALMGIVFVPLYVRYLGVEAYGLVGFFAMLQASLALVDVGMRPALSREMARFTAGHHNADSIRTLLRSVTFVGLWIASAVIVAVSVSSHWLATRWLHVEALPSDTVVRAIVAMGCVIGLRIPENVYVSAVAGLQRQVIHNVVTSVMATIRALGALALLAFFHGGIQAFFVWQGLVSVITTAAMAVVIHRILPPSEGSVKFSWPALRTIWRFAAGMTTIAVLAMLSTQMDKVLLSRMLPLSAFSYYALAGTVASVLYTVTGPINAAYNPRLAELTARGDQQALRRTYHQGAQFVTVLVGPAAIMLMVFAGRLVQLWTGDAQLTEHVVKFVPILSLSVLLNALVNMPYQLQLAHGWTRLAICTSLGAVIVVVPAIVFLVPRFGAIAAAWSGVAINGAYMAFNVQIMHSRLLKTERFNWYVRDLFVPLAAAALMAIALRAILPALPSRVFDGLLLLVEYGICLMAAVSVAPIVREQLGAYLNSKRRHAVPQRGTGQSGGGDAR